MQYIVRKTIKIFMTYVKIKNFYRIGDQKTRFLLIINLPSLGRIAYYRITLSDFKLRILIEITESPGHVIHC